MTDEHGNVFIPRGPVGVAYIKIIRQHIEAMQEWGRCNPQANDKTRNRVAILISAELAFVERGTSPAGMPREGMTIVRTIRNETPFSDTPPNCKSLPWLPEGITSPGTYGATREKFIQETIAPLNADERQEVLDLLASVEPGKKSGRPITFQKAALRDYATLFDMAGDSDKEIADKLCKHDPCGSSDHTRLKGTARAGQSLEQGNENPHVRRLRQGKDKLRNYLTSLGLVLPPKSPKKTKKTA
jgi:hypothetical protein